MANLRFTNHKSEDVVTQEFQNLITVLQDKITLGSAAPTSETKGSIYIQYTTGDDTTIVLNIRHPNTGTWRTVNLT